MSAPLTPPRFAERLLARLVVDRQAEHALLGDLAEEFASRAEGEGGRRARRWYWSQTLRAVPSLLAERRRRSAQIPYGRTQRGLSLLDLKLGVRMLLKYPGLALVGGLAIAVSIALGAAWFEFSHDFFSPSLPVPGGDRVVGIRNWNAATNANDTRLLHDYFVWRDELRSVRDIGLAHPVNRNLITGDGRAEPLPAVEISASVFRALQTPPVLGRPLVDADERPDAPSVAVIGFDVWQNRFAGERSVIGRVVRLGDVPTTIVGVMPKEFGFPVRQSVWLPIQLRPTEFQRGDGPALGVFGRLAPGATFEQAQAELTAIGQRTATAFPRTNKNLRPRVRPYVESMLGTNDVLVLYAFQTVLLFVLIIAGANVATLVFARTATRQREIAVRRALGASRGRIVWQLFAESLVLSAVAGLVGVAAVWWGQHWGMQIFWDVQGGTKNMPFWWDPSFSLRTIGYSALLVVLSAVIAGVLPAVKATSGRVQPRLQQSAADANGLRFGGLWTGIIVIQVGLSVILLPEAAVSARQAIRYQSNGLGFAAEQYLGVTLSREGDVGGMDSTGRAAFRARFSQAYRELQTRLSVEPGVVAVAVATKLPATDTRDRPAIEVEGADDVRVHVNASSVQPGFFAAFGVPVTAGRDFTVSDVDAGRRVVIVNESFVRQVLLGRNAIGARIRFAAKPNDKANGWHEIVGVVPDLAMNAFGDEDSAAGVYQALSGSVHPVQFAVRVTGDATAFAGRLRTIAAAVDPSLTVDDPISLDKSARALQRGSTFGVAIIGFVAFVALLLATVGIYALMSFTVAQRTREIGIRSALGADQRQIVSAVVSRAFAQLGVGVVLGTVVAILSQEHADGRLGFLLSIIAIVLIVGMLACVLPVRRALRVQPTEALRS